MYVWVCDLIPFYDYFPIMRSMKIVHFSNCAMQHNFGFMYGTMLSSLYKNTKWNEKSKSVCAFVITIIEKEFHPEKIRISIFMYILMYAWFLRAMSNQIIFRMPTNWRNKSEETKPFEEILWFLCSFLMVDNNISDKRIFCLKKKMNKKKTTRRLSTRNNTSKSIETSFICVQYMILNSINSKWDARAAHNSNSLASYHQQQSNENTRNWYSNGCVCMYVCTEWCTVHQSQKSIGDWEITNERIELTCAQHSIGKSKRSFKKNHSQEND